MPELVPALDRLAAQLDRPGGETFLTLAALRPFFAGCTQIGEAGTLLRNYDSTPTRSRALSPTPGSCAPSSECWMAAGGCSTA